MCFAAQMSEHWPRKPGREKSVCSNLTEVELFLVWIDSKIIKSLWNPFEITFVTIETGIMSQYTCIADKNSKLYVKPAWLWGNMLVCFVPRTRNHNFWPLQSAYFYRFGCSQQMTLLLVANEDRTFDYVIFQHAPTVDWEPGIFAVYITHSLTINPFNNRPSLVVPRVSSLTKSWLSAVVLMYCIICTGVGWVCTGADY